MPKDIENMIKENITPVTIEFESETIELQPKLSEDGSSLILYKKGIRDCEFSLNKYDFVEGTFTIPDGCLGILKPIMGEVQILPPATYEKYIFNFSMKGHSFNVGTPVATIYLVKLEKLSLVKTN